MSTRNEQENFWETKYSKDYIQKNSNFNHGLNIEGWKKILKSVSAPSNILECGANIGRNIEALNHIYPEAAKTAIEISADASKILRNKYKDLNVINSSILESKITNNSFIKVKLTSKLVLISSYQIEQYEIEIHYSSCFSFSFRL